MSIRIELLDFNYNDAERNLIDVNNSGATVGTGFTVDSKFGATWDSAGAAPGITYLSNIQNTNLVVGKEYFVSFKLSGYGGTDNMGLSASSGVSSNARLSGKCWRL